MADRDKAKALAEALAHPDDPIEERVLIFRPRCGGIIIGAADYRCDECGQVFTVEELRELVSRT